MNRHIVWRWVIMATIVVVSGFTVQISLSAAAHHQSNSPDTELFARSAVVAGDSFLYRFDPATQTFITISLSNGALPMDMAVTGNGPTHIWLTEYGRNRIGHLVYTDTTHFQLIEFPITSTSAAGPFRLTVTSTEVWFTERGANRVGRLNTLTGKIDEFYGNGLSLNSNLADLEVVPNSGVWVAAPGSKRLVQLTVTSTQVYAFREYTDTARPTFQIVPFDLAVETDNSIWMTMPDNASLPLARFTPTPPNGIFVYPQDFTSAKQDARRTIVTASGVWYTNMLNNTLDHVEVGTLPLINHRVLISAPVSLAAATSNTFWVTQQTPPSVFSRATYTPTNGTSAVSTYTLPLNDLMLTSVAVATDGSVWLTAYQPARLFLPLVKKN